MRDRSVRLVCFVSLILGTLMAAAGVLAAFTGGGAGTAATLGVFGAGLLAFGLVEYKSDVRDERYTASLIGDLILDRARAVRDQGSG